MLACINMSVSSAIHDDEWQKQQVIAKHIMHIMPYIFTTTGLILE